MAAELIETSRLWARIATAVDPGWIEDLAEHLAVYSYGEPWWDSERGSAMVKERVMLYGLTLVANRVVQLTTADNRLARELFIHHALVEQEWTAEHHFLAHNRQLINDVEAMEARSRRRDLLVEARAVFDFYDSRIPDHVVSTPHFNTWWAEQSKADPTTLHLSSDALLTSGAELVDADAFPSSWLYHDLDLELAYEFDPSSPLDGVSVLVPVEVLNQLEPGPFSWSVPGFRPELISALIRTLPKNLRRLFVPANETVDAILPALDPSDGPLLSVLGTQLGRRGGAVIPAEAFQGARVPGHLLPTFRIINADYELLAEGKDLDDLKGQLREQVASTISALAATDKQWERSGLTTWDFGSLPRIVDTGRIKAYPSLVDEGDSVAIRLHPTPAEQGDAMWLGARRLLRLNVAGPARQLDRMLSTDTKLSLVKGHVQSKAEWFNDAIAASIDTVIAEGGGPPWNKSEFDMLVTQARNRLPDLLSEVAGAMTELLITIDEVYGKLDRLTAANYAVSIDDVRAHLGRLAYPGLLAGVGLHRVDDIVRYLQAIARRLDGLVKSPTRDLEALAICRRLDNELAELASTYGPSDDIEDVTWMLEELRVSLFAQSLGTKGKISEKRIRRALNDIRSPRAG